MKLFKRLAAAALAAAMVLTMLTACGSAAKTPTETAEDALMLVMNTMLGTNKPNDAAMKAAAKAYLEECLNEDGTLKPGYEIEKDTVIDENTTQVVYIFGKIPAAQVDKLNDTDALKQQAEKQQQTIKENMKAYMTDEQIDAYFKGMNAGITAMGMGAVQKGDYIYIAVSAVAANEYADAI